MLQITSLQSIKLRINFRNSVWNTDRSMYTIEEQWKIIRLEFDLVPNGFNRYALRYRP